MLSHKFAIENIVGLQSTVLKEMEQVPLDILKKVAGFLRYPDVLRLSQTSNSLCDSLGITSLQLPYPTFPPSAVWSGSSISGDLPRKCCSLPFVVMKNYAHTIIVRGSYVDQQWGHQKGRLYIIGSRASGQHRVVATSPAAKHKETAFALEFLCPTTSSHEEGDEEAFQLWYSVGGGGGHSLRVSNLVIETVILDSDARQFLNIWKEHHPVEAGNDLPMLRIMQTMSRKLLGQWGQGGTRELDCQANSYFSSQGISTGPSSTFAVNQIVTSLIQAGGAPASSSNGASPERPNDPLPHQPRLIEEENLYAQEDGVLEVQIQLFGRLVARITADKAPGAREAARH